MKRILSMILTIALLVGITGCKIEESNNLMEGFEPNKVILEPEVEKKSDAAMDFALHLFRQCAREGGNTLVSPLSVLTALSMTANGAAGDTLTQMEAVLGADVEALNGYLLQLRESLPSEKKYKLSIANSIWFRDDGVFEANPNFLQTNANYYGAEIYQSSFGKNTVDQINRWVKTNTDGMIPTIVDEIPEETVMYLINALAFDGEWEKIYEENQIWPDQFHIPDFDGTMREVEMMHSVEGAYLEDDMARGFLKYYADRRYAFAALLPNEGVSVQEYIAALEGDTLMELLSNPRDISVDAGIPKFETEYFTELNDVLRAMGMTDLFDSRLANLSRLGSTADGNLYVSQVLHKTYMAVDERGTKAGAATSVAVDRECSVEIGEVETVILDRPFVYMIVDCESGMPIFMGTMIDPTGEAKELPQSETEPIPIYTEKQPPALTVTDGEQTIPAILSTHMWDYDNGDGTRVGICADCIHPLQSRELLMPLITDQETVELAFDYPPDEVIVSCWSDAHWDNPQAPEEPVHLNGNTLYLKNGGYIYLVQAKWTAEPPASSGTAAYVFYAMSVMPVQSASTELFSLLAGLDYDPARVCKCLPEITVTAESGMEYGISLSEGYARCEAGQAELTEEQLELIRDLLEK